MNRSQPNLQSQQKNAADESPSKNTTQPKEIVTKPKFMNTNTVKVVETSGQQFRPAQANIQDLTTPVLPPSHSIQIKKAKAKELKMAKDGSGEETNVEATK